jgi:hypothetical protein
MPMELLPSTPGVQIKMRVDEEQPLVDLAVGLVSAKSATPLLLTCLSCLQMEAQHAQWLCGDLEATAWQAGAPPATMQRCLTYERSAAQRVQLHGALL